ncbi:MAG: hypothetical protein HFE92_05265 [Acutalibacter muris]|nr:hypothetical protein [Acutalibacter muris]
MDSQLCSLPSGAAGYVKAAPYGFWERYEKSRGCGSLTFSELMGGQPGIQLIRNHTFENYQFYFLYISNKFFARAIDNNNHRYYNIFAQANILKRGTDVT